MKNERGNTLSILYYSIFEKNMVKPDTNEMKIAKIYTLFLIILIVPLGFATKFYRGWGEVWINNSLGSVFYVIFWCLIIYLIKPGIKPKNIAIGVFVVTSIIEILQLWHPAILQRLRSTMLGVTFLGNCFALTDFAYYILGALLGYFVLSGISKYATKI